MAWYREPTWDVKQARTLWDAGHTYSEIARAVGSSQTALQRHAIAKGWPQRRKGPRSKRVVLMVRRDTQGPKAHPVKVRCSDCWNTYEATSDRVFTSQCPHCAASTTTRGAA